MIAKTISLMKFVGIVSGLVLALALPSTAQSPVPQKDRYTVYLAVWRGCEEACEGFVNYIEENEVPADVIVRDADRDKEKLKEFVKEVRETKPDLVVTWGTSVTDGMIGPKDTDHPDEFIGEIPSLFMIVADPVGAKIVDSYESSGRPMVTGTRNRVPVEVQLKAMQEYRPFKRFAIIYNENELNSRLNAEAVRQAAHELKLDLLQLSLPLYDGKPSVDDIPKLIQEAADQGAEFLFIGSSSFLQVNADLYNETATRLGIPVATSYASMVSDNGALLAIASKYGLVGRLAGYQAKRILVDKVPPIDLPIASLDRHSYIINIETADKLKLYPPISLLNYAEIVGTIGAQ
ncbi:ABC transporter substrate binding protein [uncultured Cohaesibacter sp.]|uniref:ABC transporter substrate binding protein n=1 Tax=uncultured Cohaesibacter sp. TaxID=1002546 RepID=UPI0029C91231|nr:ABC transporter substrate binding protein [uncultured Cohaesibacter sp.]